MKKMVLAAVSVVLIAAGVVGYMWWQSRVPQVQPSAPMPAQSRHLVRTEGRVAGYLGSDITVGTEVGGIILRTPVEEGQALKKGQLVAVMDASKDDQDIAQARAKMIGYRADVEYQESELKRVGTLAAEGILSRQMLDQTTAQLKVAKAKMDAAQALEESLKVTRSKRSVYAPFDGVVLSRMVHPGETVLPGAPLLRMAKKGPLRVEAEVDEFDLSLIRLGMAVKVMAEGMETTWKGRVEEIPDFVEQRKLKPEDPGRPVDTRVLLVKVALLEATPLKIGQRVELELLQEPPAGVPAKNSPASINPAQTSLPPSSPQSPSTPQPPPAKAERSPSIAPPPVHSPSAEARLKAIQIGDLDLAARQGQDHLKALPRQHWCLRLAIARRKETVQNLANAFAGGQADVFLVRKGILPDQATYLLFSGDYASKSDAAADIHLLPPLFTSGDRPLAIKVQTLAKYLRLPAAPTPVPSVVPETVKQ
jgi:multidrug efflux pump subunit AcrA (membrane-fusion protein)